MRIRRIAVLSLITATLVLLALCAPATAAKAPKTGGPVTAEPGKYETPGITLLHYMQGSGGTPPYTYEIVSPPAHGRVSLHKIHWRTKGQKAKYHPERGFRGEDGYTYRATDSQGQVSEPTRIVFRVTSAGAGRYYGSPRYEPPPHLAKIGATENRLFKLGFLDVTLYDGWEGNPVDPTGARDSTKALQKAIDDGYEYQLIVFFPTGTYTVSDTLYSIKKRIRFVNFHNNTLAGSTRGPRPVIRLRKNAPGFDDPEKPKPIVWISQVREKARKGFGTPGNEFEIQRKGVRSAAMGFFQSIRDLTIDCNGTAGNSGAVGLRFAAAQNSEIHNLNVIATGAFAGIWDIPSRSSAGAANVEVEGGQYGLYLTSGASSVVVGATLRNQKKAAFYSRNFPPVAMVGFHIVKDSGPVIKMDETAWSTAGGTMTLYDGIVELKGDGPAFDNTAGRNFYLRNVYVKGTRDLVAGPKRTVQGQGGWQHIVEYAQPEQYTKERKGPYEPGAVKFAGYTAVDGKIGRDEVVSIRNAASGPPPNLVSRHLWNELPSFEDPDCVVLTEVCKADGTDDADDLAEIQKAINTHRKIFVPKGRYRVSNTLTLLSHTQLFGGDRAQARIYSHPDWRPNQEATIIQTVNDPNATTYLGNIHIGFQMISKERDWFNVLHWRAGRRSMVFGVTERNGAEGFRSGKQKGADLTTNPHSMYKITDGGGGRWYFWGVDKNSASLHPEYQHMLIENTTEPLWLYGCNLEKGLGAAACHIRNSRNVRTFSTKVELSYTIFKVHNSANVGIFSSGVMHGPPKSRHGSASRSAYMWLSGQSSNVVLANINPTKAGKDHDGTWLICDETTGRQTGLPYPTMAAVYKRGELDDGAMW